LKLKYLIFLTIFIVISNAYAAGFEAEITPVKNVLLPGEQEATFEVSITNDESYTDHYIFSTLDPDWTVSSSPQSPYISSGSTGSATLTLTPNKNQIGDFSVIIVVTSAENILKTSNEIFRVSLLDYSNLIQTKLEIPESIDPNKKSLFHLKLINDHNILLENLNANVESDFFTKTQEGISLNPYETKTLDFIIEFSGNLEKGSYPVFTNIFYNDQKAFSVQDEMLIGYYPKVYEIETPETGFMLRKGEITKINDGNLLSHETYIKKLTTFEKLYTFTNPDPTSISKEDGFYIYTWNFDLQPGQSKTISVQTNYRVFLIELIILVAVIYLLIFLFKSDISLEKRIVTIKHGKEESSIKVQLLLRNRSILPFKNVKLMDHILHITEKPKEFGMLMPNKVVKSTSGYKIIWLLPELRAKEEKIISYKVTSKIKEITKTVATKAVLRYKKKNLTKTITSNKTSVFN